MSEDIRKHQWRWTQQIENLPDDWEQQIYERCIPCCYIVHDKDSKLDDDGSLVPVKPHIHVMDTYHNAVRYNYQLDNVPSSFGVKYVEPVASKIGSYRYFLHLKNPDENKHVYTDDDMVCLHGFKINLSEVYDVCFDDLFELIEDCDIRNFSVLVQVCMRSKKEFVPYIQAHANLLRSYLRDLPYAVLN